MITHTSKAKVDMILAQVSKCLMVEVKDLISKRKSQNLVLGRRIAMNIIRSQTLCTLREIGSFFSNRDHSTVIFNLSTHDDFMQYNKAYRATYNEILSTFAQDIWQPEQYPVGYTLTNGIDFYGFYRSKKHAQMLATEFNLTLVNIQDIKTAK
jgi:hypothetical protein